MLPQVFLELSETTSGFPEFFDKLSGFLFGCIHADVFL
jgi:hypothetical protein